MHAPGPVVVTHGRTPPVLVTVGQVPPMLWRIGVGTTFEAQLSAGTSGTALKYRWQEPLLLMQGMISTLQGSGASVNTLELSWEDGHGEQIVTSGIAAQALSAGAFSGSSNQIWFPLNIRVKRGEIHTLQFSNVTGGTTATPRLLIRAARISG